MGLEKLKKARLSSAKAVLSRIDPGTTASLFTDDVSMTNLRNEDPQMYAAIEIQRCWRGHRGRKEALEQMFETYRAQEVEYREFNKRVCEIAQSLLST